MHPSLTNLHGASPIGWRIRVRAALIHLGASITVAAVVATMVFAFWYPGAYRSFSGGTELFLLVVGVDLGLGPLITLVIFDRRKPIKELKRDVAVVVVLQLAALVYGLNMVSISRPVVLALEEDRFRVVPAINGGRQPLQTVHVDDAAAALLQALDRSPPRKPPLRPQETRSM